jgi:hypothetical protein
MPEHLNIDAPQQAFLPENPCKYSDLFLIFIFIATQESNTSPESWNFADTLSSSRRESFTITAYSYSMKAVS